jgi:hypothetical protein
MHGDYLMEQHKAIHTAKLEKFKKRVIVKD